MPFYYKSYISTKNFPRLTPELDQWMKSEAKISIRTRRHLARNIDIYQAVVHLRQTLFDVAKQFNLSRSQARQIVLRIRMAIEARERMSA